MLRSKKTGLLIFLIGTLFLINTGISFADYTDPNMPIPDRVADLLSRMTLAEKVGQMIQIDKGKLASNQDIATYYLGSLLSGGGSVPTPNTPLAWAEMYNSYQSIAMSTRLRIPLLYGIDAVHGNNNVRGAVIFPHNIGMGSTWNPDLVESCAYATAVETRALGINWTFAPCVDVGRNIRWGRTYETFAEDAYLCGVMGEKAVNGFQGSNLTSLESVLATAKHYMGSGGTTNGTDQGDCVAEMRIIREVHLAPFIHGVKANTQTIMPSYCSINGQKMHGNQYLLTDVLKVEQGFGNFLISDWAAVDQTNTNYKTALKICVNAGIDMIMGPDRYATIQQYLTELVNSGDIPIARINDAVSRILTVKFRQGLFENPYIDTSRSWYVGTNNHRAIARQAVRESIVLLKNSNNILPLSKNLSKIFVGGKSANSMVNQCGGWTLEWQGATNQANNPPPGQTILTAIKNTVSPGATVVYSADGTGAAGSNVGIVVVGETPYAEGQGDTTTLDLTSTDLTAINNVKNAGVPVVVVMIAGRPRTVETQLPNWDAFLMAWLPGTEGQGVADVLFGDYDVSGRLSQSWPRTVSQEPLNYDYRPGTTYDPLFPFGYGLSYTTFVYSNLSVTPSSNVGAGDTVTVSVTAQNTGTRSGSEVVQVYVQDVASTLSTPVNKLYRFKKISLAAGASQNVSFTIPVAELGYYTDNAENVVEAGAFNVKVGGLTSSFTVTTGGTFRPPITAPAPLSQPAEPTMPDSVGPGTGTGLTGAYYTSTSSEKFAVLKGTVVDSTIDFPDFTTRLKQITGVSSLCAVRWTGKIEPRYSENYTFYAKSDDGIRLWVDGKLLVDRWVNQGPTEFYNSISLNAGTKYDIKVEYYQNRTGAVAQLSWSSKSQSKAIIPQTQLYTQ